MAISCFLRDIISSLAFMSNCIFCFLDDSASFDNSSTYKVSKKLELWVTSLSDTPCLQYYDVQTLEYRYISKLPM